MKFGITGTQHGFDFESGSGRQFDSMSEWFNLCFRLPPSVEYHNGWKKVPHEFHHGMCVGVDEAAHNYVRFTFPSVKIIGHPPENESKMAKVKCDELRRPAEYIRRNHLMVDEIQVLFVVPREQSEVLRSGTWATYRYAKKIGRIYVLILPYQG